MQKKGFTLVELIAVIAIMAALMIIAGVNIYKFRDSANNKSLANIKSNIEKATEMYFESNSNEIIYQCKNDPVNCMCNEEFTENSGTYKCKIKLIELLKKGIYNNINENSECLNSKTCVIDPTNNSSLDEKDIEITIGEYSSSATLILN